MKNSGFTLLELSVVITIIALIIGGIMAGSKMIRNAEVQTVIADFEKFKSAVDVFESKYQSLPGDMPDATDYWGEAHATPATCKVTASTGSETCNGDGDGEITASTGSAEFYRFWQHLVNAELISGKFTGITGPGGSQDAIIGENVPEAGLTGAGWSIIFAGSTGNSTRYAVPFDNSFLFGTENPGTTTNDPIITAAEALAIDTKIDDGKPAYGMVIAKFWNNLCSAADDGTHAKDDLEASYKLSDNTPQCALYFRQLF